MPFKMGIINSVVIGEVVYVGGGEGNLFDNQKREYVVMTYHANLERWDTLPLYRACLFGMTAIRDQLVLVGGKNSGRYCKSLGVWRTDDKKWVDIYPDMPTPRCVPSVVTYNEWLVVAGGNNGAAMSTVEVMNIDTKQWYSGPSAPKGFYLMKAATVGDMCYYVGGYYALLHYTKDVYRVSLPALISQVKSKSIDLQIIWEAISTPNVILSSPLSIGGHLLVLGGNRLGRLGLLSSRVITSIQHYHSDTDRWVEVGDIPPHRYSFTCAITSNGDILMAGGFKNIGSTSSCAISSIM